MGALCHVRSPKELLRTFVPSMQTARVLNSPEPGAAPNATLPPADSAGIGSTVRHLRSLMHALETAAFVDGRVDYRGLAASETYVALQRAASKLRTISPETIVPGPRRMAFWTNLYNVLAIHGVIALKINKSAMEVPTFFQTVSYQVGTHTYSLDDIENGVLRRNALNPARGKPQWPVNDLRLPTMVTSVDPRIHAALVCTAKACPPVAAYDPDKLDGQFQMAASGYVATQVVVNHKAHRVEVPITLDYYAADFDTGNGAPAGVHQFMVDHASEPHRREIQEALDESWPLFYRAYDWTLNGTDIG